MKKRFLLLFILSFLFFSCKKKSGLGGKATVHVHVINGSSNVSFINVHVNFNSTSYPGATATGDHIITTDQKGLADFNDLKRGSYYFFVNEIIQDTLYPGGKQVDIESKKGEQHIVIDISEKNPM